MQDALLRPVAANVRRRRSKLVTYVLGLALMSFIVLKPLSNHANVPLIQIPGPDLSTRGSSRWSPGPAAMLCGIGLGMVSGRRCRAEPPPPPSHEDPEGIQEFFNAMASVSQENSRVHDTLARLKQSERGRSIVNQLKAAYASGGTKGLRDEIVNHPEVREAIMRAREEIEGGAESSGHDEKEEPTEKEYREQGDGDRTEEESETIEKVEKDREEKERDKEDKEEEGEKEEKEGGLDEGKEQRIEAQSSGPEKNSDENEHEHEQPEMEEPHGQQPSEPVPPEEPDGIEPEAIETSEMDAGSGKKEVQGDAGTGQGQAHMDAGHEERESGEQHEKKSEGVEEGAAAADSYESHDDRKNVDDDQVYDEQRAYDDERMEADDGDGERRIPGFDTDAAAAGVEDECAQDLEMGPPLMDANAGYGENEKNEGDEGVGTSGLGGDNEQGGDEEQDQDQEPSGELEKEGEKEDEEEDDDDGLVKVIEEGDEGKDDANAPKAKDVEDEGMNEEDWRELFRGLGFEKNETEPHSEAAEEGKAEGSVELDKGDKDKEAFVRASLDFDDRYMLPEKMLQKALEVKDDGVNLTSQILFFDTAWILFKQESVRKIFDSLTNEALQSNPGFEPHTLLLEPRLGDSFADKINTFIDFHVTLNTHRIHKGQRPTVSQVTDKNGTIFNYVKEPASPEDPVEFFDGNTARAFEQETREILKDFIKNVRQTLSAFENVPKAKRLFVKAYTPSFYRSLEDIRAVSDGNWGGGGRPPWLPFEEEFDENGKRKVEYEVKPDTGEVIKKISAGLFDDILRNFTTDSEDDEDVVASRLPKSLAKYMRKKPNPVATIDTAASWEELQEGIAVGIMRKYGISRRLYEAMCKSWDFQTAGEEMLSHMNLLTDDQVLRQKQKFAELFPVSMVDHPIDVWVDQQQNLYTRYQNRWFFGEMDRRELERKLQGEDSRYEILHNPIFVDEDVFKERVALLKKTWEKKEWKMRLDRMPDQHAFQQREIARLRKEFESERDIVNKQGVRNFLANLKTMDPQRRMSFLRYLKTHGFNTSTPHKLHEFYHLRYIRNTMLRIPPPKNNLFKPVVEGNIRQAVVELNDYRNGGPAATDEHGRNVLHHFVTQDVHSDIVKILASEGVPWTAVDHEDNTILHYAVAYDKKKMVRAIRQIKGSHWLTMMKNKEGLRPIDIALKGGEHSLILRHKKTLELLDPEKKKETVFPDPLPYWVDSLERLGYGRSEAYAALKFTRNSLDMAYKLLNNFPKDKILEMGQKRPLPKFMCANSPGPLFESYELEHQLEELAVMYASRLLENVTSIKPEERRSVAYNLYGKIKLKLKNKARHLYHIRNDYKDFVDYDLMRVVRVYMGWEHSYSFNEDDTADKYIDTSWLESQPQLTYLFDDPTPQERKEKLRTGTKLSLMKQPFEVLRSRVRRIWRTLRNNDEEVQARQKIDGTNIRALELAVARVAEMNTKPSINVKEKEKAVDLIIDALYPTGFKRIPFINEMRARSPTREKA